MYHPPVARARQLGRLAVAVVWLYNGAWCKLLRRCPSHVAILTASFGETAGTAALVVLGALETGLAFWVLSRRAPRLAAAVQTGLLVAMNAGGLLWGAESIAEPVGLIVQNLAFLALVWLVALDRSEAS